jgi:predicted transcriptional regulator
VDCIHITLLLDSKENEKDILEVLTHETARKILMFIIEQKSPTQTDLASSVKISARSVTWRWSLGCP